MSLYSHDMNIYEYDWHWYKRKCEHADGGNAYTNPRTCGRCLEAALAQFVLAMSGKRILN
jgi:hypothetical protein